MYPLLVARRSQPELVAPARATPRGTKALSDVDDDDGLRYLQPELVFFRGCTIDGHRPPDPAKAIKAALAEALVYYYPLAGRLREVPGGKLVVECTGEGVVFVEADAEVSLEELGEPLLPQSPSVQELLCDVGDVRVVVGVPLFFMQVTRFRCGGFNIGYHICHNIADGPGITQFIKAIADIVRGEAAQITPPVWERELLTARIPPRINPADESMLDRLGSPSDDVMLSTPPEAMVGRYFLFSQSDVAALRRTSTPRWPESVTTFELLTAVMWRCRTAALGYEPHRLVRLMFSLNARGRWKRPTPIPQGFYGNAIFYPRVEATVGELCGNPLGHTLQLIREAKDGVAGENMESMVDFIASLRGRPPIIIDRLYEVSDGKWSGQDAVDFGWGKHISRCMPVDIGDVSSNSVSYHMRCKNNKDDDIIAVSMFLPGPAMEKFSKEIAVWLDNQDKASFGSCKIRSRQ